MIDRPDSQDEETYRVIGIRCDGTRLLLAEQVTLARANAIEDALVATHAYREAVIETECESAAHVL